MFVGNNCSNFAQAFKQNVEKSFSLIWTWTNPFLSTENCLALCHDLSHGLVIITLNLQPKLKHQNERGSWKCTNIQTHSLNAKKWILSTHEWKTLWE